MKKVNVGIFGGTGYTGGELCRLLLNHPEVQEILPTSREDLDFNRYYQALSGTGINFIRPADLEKKVQEGRIDIAFFSLLSGEAMKLAPMVLDAGVKIIDLGADFRFKDPRFYEKIYGKKHECPELCRETVYGITELNRKDIRKSRLVANPGCYVITAMLGLAPILDKGLISLDHIPVFGIHGMTGAGNKPERATIYTEVEGNILPYQQTHRHSWELENEIKEFSGQEAKVNFTPSYGPFSRGTIVWCNPLVKEYSKIISRDELLRLYSKYYKNEFFIRVNQFPRTKSESQKEYDIYPQIKNVRGTNFCDIGLDYDQERGIAKIITVTDNLVKGAAGSAIQNMNVMFGFDEKDGLKYYGI